MKCPKCSKSENKVVDSRMVKEGNAIRRRRECSACGYRFTTYEYIEKFEIIVQKSNGTSEEFDREKLKKGILIACRKRPISPKEIDMLVNNIYIQISDTYSGSINSGKIGEIVSEKLKEVDEVAYIRFASVYRKFKDVKEFMTELKNIINN